MAKKITKTIIFEAPHELFVEIKIMSILTNRTMSEFLRMSAQKMIKELKKP